MGSIYSPGVAARTQNLRPGELSAAFVSRVTVHASESRGRLVWLMSVPLSPSRPETVIQHNPWPHRNRTVSGDCLARPSPGDRGSESLEGISQEPSGVSALWNVQGLKSCRLHSSCALNLPGFPLIPFPWFRIPHRVCLSCLLQLVQFLGLSLSFMTLRLRRVLVRCFFQNVPYLH